MNQVLHPGAAQDAVIRAAIAFRSSGYGTPVLVGRPEVIAMRIEKAGLRIAAERDFEGLARLFQRHPELLATDEERTAPVMLE